MTQRLEKHEPDNERPRRYVDRAALTRVIAGVLLLCTVGTAVVLIGMRIIFGTTVNEPTSIEVKVDGPAEVALNEPFAVTIRVSNLLTTSQTLHSFDLDTTYLENVQLNGSTPAYQSVHSLPLTRFDSYRYFETLPPNTTTAVELQFVGQKAGRFSGLIDICLDDGNLCMVRPLETTIVE